MTAADRLRALAAEATPGPWAPTEWRTGRAPDTTVRRGVNGRYPGPSIYITTNAVCEILEYTPDQSERAPANAHLVALAPDLAAWAADAAGLIAIYAETNQYPYDTDLLARLDRITEGATRG